MEDAKGANEINDRIMSIFDHSETSETQEIPVVAAFHEYVNPLTHRIRSSYLISIECGLTSVPRRPRLCKSVLQMVSVNTPRPRRE